MEKSENPDLEKGVDDRNERKYRVCVAVTLSTCFEADITFLLRVAKGTEALTTASKYPEANKKANREKEVNYRKKTK